MRILTRYLLRLHVAPFMFALMGLTVLLLLDQVSRRFHHLVGKGLHWSVIGEVFLYSIPFIVAQTWPMAVLIAVLYVYTKLALDHEMTAMRATGIPLARTLVPLLVAATLMTTGMTLFNDTVLPESNHRLQMLLTSIAQKKPTLQLLEQTINEVLPARLYVQAARIDRVNDGLEDLVLYDERSGLRSRTIYADSAAMTYDSTRTDMFLTLHSGIMHDREKDKPDSFQRVHFDKMIMRVAEVSNQLKRDSLGAFRGDREMKISQMREIVDEADRTIDLARGESREFAVALSELLSEGAVRPIEVTETGQEMLDELTEPDSPASPEGLRSEASLAAMRVYSAPDAFNQFENYDDRVKAGIGRGNKYGVEIQKKYTIPAACIVFVLIGATIAVRYRNAGIALVVAVSLAVFAAYYVSLVGGEELSDRRLLSPFWAMWASNILFAIIGLWLLWKTFRAPR